MPAALAEILSVTWTIGEDTALVGRPERGTVLETTEVLKRQTA